MDICYLLVDGLLILTPFTISNICFLSPSLLACSKNWNNGVNIFHISCLFLSWFFTCLKYLDKGHDCIYLSHSFVSFLCSSWIKQCLMLSSLRIQTWITIFSKIKWLSQMGETGRVCLLYICFSKDFSSLWMATTEGTWKKEPR